MDENTILNKFSGHNFLVYAKGQTITVTGISGLVSYDDTIIVVDVCDVLLTIEGIGFSITDVNVEKGVLSARGSISAAYYAEKKLTPKSMLSRLIGR